MYQSLLVNYFNRGINLKVHFHQTVSVQPSHVFHAFYCTEWLDSTWTSQHQRPSEGGWASSKSWCQPRPSEQGESRTFTANLTNWKWCHTSFLWSHINLYSNFCVYYPDSPSYYTTNVHIHQFYFSKELWLFVEPENRSDFTQCKFSIYSSV